MPETGTRRYGRNELIEFGENGETIKGVCAYKRMWTRDTTNRHPLSLVSAHASVVVDDSTHTCTYNIAFS